MTLTVVGYHVGYHYRYHGFVNNSSKKWDFWTSKPLPQFFLPRSSSSTRTTLTQNFSLSNKILYLSGCLIMWLKHSNLRCFTMLDICFALLRSLRTSSMVNLSIPLIFKNHIYPHILNASRRLSMASVSSTLPSLQLIAFYHPNAEAKIQVMATEDVLHF